MANERVHINVEWGTLRVKVDTVINELHDELTDCYYNYWKLGNSKGWPAALRKNRQLDVQGSLVDSKLQFDLAHGLLPNLHTILMYKINQLDGDYDEDAMFSEVAEDGTVLDPLVKVVAARAWITNLLDTYGINPQWIKQYVAEWVDTNLAKTVDLD